MFKNGRWAMKHDQCIKCNTTESEHMGRGVCSKCYDKARNKTTKRKIKRKEYNVKYMETKPGAKEKVAERSKAWHRSKNEIMVILNKGKYWKKIGKPCIEYKGKPIPLDITSKDKEEKRKWQAVKQYIDNRTRPGQVKKGYA